MAVVTESEMRAVIAHEFGHFHGGDTRVGPWVHKTRSAIARTVANLRRRGIRWLHLPFEWYGLMSIRITQAISRRQEYAADELAAAVVSPEAPASGLCKIRGAAVCYPDYIQSFVLAMERGVLVPFVSGFERLPGDAGASERLARFVERSIAEEKADRFDSHPPMRERIAALLGDGAIVPDTGGEHAHVWFQDVSGLERRLAAHALRGTGVSRLRAVEWTQTAELVVIPSWTERCAGSAQHLRASTLSDVPRMARDADRIGLRMLGPSDRAQRRSAVWRLLTASFGLALHRRGWRAVGEPGFEATFTRGKMEIRPGRMIRELLDDDRAVAARSEFLALYDLHGEPRDPAAARGSTSRA
jgi:hypothetical protein